ncbi:MAG: dihydrolipoyl dehydrogenase [Candidatus Cloacimonadota bacterium]|nr:MAG: dihydrolipoyl dehydrogenase [Candidatus Cloacimonadota bacterium]
MIKVDIAIIGTGTAGMGAYKAAIKHTDSIALIEESKYGTTCARVGCMPSKLLIAAADAIHHAQSLEPFGAKIDGKIIIDGVKVMHRIRSERDRFVGFVLETVKDFNPKHLYQSKAHFINKNTLQLSDGQKIQAKSIIIATGSRTFIPKEFDKLESLVITNDNIFDLDTLPKSVAVVGPGVIGLELGQALHRLNVKTTIFGRGGRVGFLTAPTLKSLTKKILSKELNLQHSSTIKNMKVVPSGVEIEYLDNSGNPQKETFEKVLVTTGRIPNTDKIQIENTGIQLDNKSRPIFDSHTMQCSNSNIFIAGDANNELTILHEASDEGRIAGTNAALYPNIRNKFRRSKLSIAFCNPQLAIIAESYDNLIKNKVNFVTGVVSFKGQGRSRVMLVNQGELHVFFDKTSHLFLGAEMIGPRAEHLAHLLAWSHQSKLTIDKMLQMPFYHPVIEEGLKTALNDARMKL